MPGSGFAELVTHIEETWKFTPEEYPELSDLGAARRFIFVIRHILWHQMKSTGVLAAVCEGFEHKDCEDVTKLVGFGSLRTLALKMIFNGIRLALHLGMSAEDIARELPGVVRTK